VKIFPGFPAEIFRCTGGIILDTTEAEALEFSSSHYRGVRRVATITYQMQVPTTDRQHVPGVSFAHVEVVIAAHRVIAASCNSRRHGPAGKNYRAT